MTLVRVRVRVRVRAIVSGPFRATGGRFGPPFCQNGPPRRNFGPLGGFPGHPSQFWATLAHFKMCHFWDFGPPKCATFYFVGHLSFHFWATLPSKMGHHWGYSGPLRSVGSGPHFGLGILILLLLTGCQLRPWPFFDNKDCFVTLGFVLQWAATHLCAGHRGLGLP